MKFEKTSIKVYLHDSSILDISSSAVTNLKFALIVHIHKPHYLGPSQVLKRDLWKQAASTPSTFPPPPYTHIKLSFISFKIKLTLPVSWLPTFFSPCPGVISSPSLTPTWEATPPQHQAQIIHFPASVPSPQMVLRAPTLSLSDCIKPQELFDLLGICKYSAHCKLTGCSFFESVNIIYFIFLYFPLKYFYHY